MKSDCEKSMSYMIDMASIKSDVTNFFKVNVKAVEFVYVSGFTHFNKHHSTMVR